MLSTIIKLNEFKIIFLNYRIVFVSPSSSEFFGDQLIWIPAFLKSGQ